MRRCRVTCAARHHGRLTDRPAWPSCCIDFFHRNGRWPAQDDSRARKYRLRERCMNRPMEPVTSPETAGTLVSTLKAKLATFTERVRDEPKYDPVGQIAYHLSRDLESGAVTRQQLAALASDLAVESLAARARSLADYVGPVDPAANRTRLRAAITRLLDAAGSEEAGLDLLARRALGIIFTAHPTFLLSTPLRHALANAASGREVTAWPLPVGPDARITLTDEHGAAMDALDAAKV
eukprot:gene20398-21012_t